jgi:hypothetical protein
MEASMSKKNKHQNKDKREHKPQEAPAAAPAATAPATDAAAERGGEDEELLKPGEVVEAEDPGEDAEADEDDGDDYEDEQGDGGEEGDLTSLRPHWLFRTSAFVLVTAGIFVAFGGLYLALTTLPPITFGLIEAHANLVIRALLFAVLLVSAGILMKLHAVLVVLQERESRRGYIESGTEWFLKMGTIAFAALAAFVLVRGLLETKMAGFAIGNELTFVLRYTKLYWQRCALWGSFFLGMALFSLVQLISTKLVRGTEFERDF